MEKLQRSLRELESKISQQSIVNASVSATSVGWHIEHALLTINLIIRELQKSNPADYKWTFNHTRTLVFTVNKIPRGRAKSPEIVQPKLEFNIETLNEHLKTTLENLKQLNNIESNKYFTHPFFGKLNLKPTIKFLNIHTKHHLDIINNIINGVDKNNVSKLNI